MMKTIALVALVLVSFNALAARSWKSNGVRTVEKATDLAGYKALRSKYPDVFIQEIDEAKFHRAQVETRGWIYIGNTLCESDDPRLETETRSGTICLKDPGIPFPLCAFSTPSAPKDEDPCRN